MGVGLGLGCELTTAPESPAAVPPRVVQAPTLTPAQVDAAVLAAAVKAGVRPRSANEAVYEVDPFLAALTVLDLQSARPSVALAPALADGAQIGVRITGVKEGSVYGAVGLLDGDVIESINGLALTAPDVALAALTGSERGAVIEVTRAGVRSVLELRLAGGLAWSQLRVARGVAPPPEPPALAEATGPIDQVPPDMSPGTGSGGGERPRKPTDAAYRPPADGGNGSSGGGVQCGPDGACSVPRGEFDAMVADPSRLLRQVKVAPAGRGYRLSGIRPGSQVSQLGFRNGDLLLSVNGTSLDDDLGLLALYAGLAGTRSYNVVFERGGARQTRTIRLRG